MEPLYTTKIKRIGTSNGISIPVDILRGLNWKRGDRVIFTFGFDDTLIIKTLDDETIRRLKNYGAENDEPVITIQ